MDIKRAAREVIRGILEREPLCERPYEAMWRRNNDSLFVYGPCVQFDWMEGKPRGRTRDQVLCVSFDDEAVCLHVYDWAKPLFHLKGCHLYFEYANPFFQKNLLDAAKRIIEHHGVLVEEERDDYREWVSELKRKGRWNLGVPDFADVPWGRYPNSTRKFRRDY